MTAKQKYLTFKSMFIISVVLLLARGIVLVLGHYWLNSSTPLHAVTKDHAATLLVCLGQIYERAILLYALAYGFCAIMVGFTLAFFEETALYNILQIFGLLFLFLDLYFLHLLEDGTNGAASNFWGLHFIVITTCALTIKSKTIFTVYWIMNVISYVILYLRCSIGKSIWDLITVIAIYSLYYIFLMIFRVLAGSEKYRASYRL